ncbi:uncharacterized protein LOC112904435 [Agrilus planipennis]|uniref:Uncharacterized protein LOC112904435 n=1 Tax=Agrilus planipennis TaxID=224129 RepID=A0A7F5QYD0_AGRPL|nr:uncharacterized protein LOC112904435 [Agrilus planipennis]
MSIKHIFVCKDVPFPSGTTKEEQRVWSGWCEMGDREVVREAAVKGVHVQLAIKFLATRNHTAYEKAQTVFNQEVNLWVHELLNRKQIFRASHILNNMKLDPVLEMTQIFVETDKKDLRNYIGDHLCKISKMPENFIVTWNLLKAIENKSNILSRDENYTATFSEINKKDHKWKCKVGTKLFFSTFDFQLKPYLEKEIMWEFLLKNNNKSLLKLWIDLSFSENQDIDCELENLTIDQKAVLKELFKSYEISKEMVDLLCENSTCIEDELRDFVLNELCKFGMFCSKEVNDVVYLIRRIINTTGISELYDLLKKNQIGHFLNSFTKHCIKNKYYIPLNVVLNQIGTQCFDYNNFNSEHLNIIISTKHLATNFRNDNNFIKNIFDFAKLLSGGDLHSYFIENPLIFLSLVLFNDKNLLLPIKGKGSEYLHNFEIDLKFLEKAVEKLPVVRKLVAEINTETSTTLTIYDLLEKHANVDVKNVFNFRFSNDSSFPTFTSHTSLLDYTYKKKINFLTYIRQERPSIAALSFYTSSNANEEVLRKIEKFAYKNYNKPKLTATCIAFLRMIGEDCYKLRNHIHIANLLDLEFDSKGRLLFSLTPEDVIKDIENLYSSDIINLMECFNVYNFVDILKKYKVLINFAKYHETKYPEQILVKLAENNHWLAFLIFVQYFNYPENQISKVCVKFKNTALSEHLQHALFNDIKVEESKTSLMRERNSRNFFLSRIGVRKTIDNCIAPVDQGYSSISFMSQTSSAESSSGSSSISEYETEMTHQGEQIDLLKVLVKCHNSTDPPKMLLHSCYLFKCPLLAIFATSYEIKDQLAS